MIYVYYMFVEHNSGMYNVVAIVNLKCHVFELFVLSILQCCIQSSSEVSPRGHC